MKKYTSFYIYTEYVALKAHFTSQSFNYFAYNKKTSVKKATFDARNDKYFFEKLSRHKDPIRLMVANFSENPNIWIGELTSKDGEECYKKWLKRTQSLQYTFKDQLGKLLPDFDSNIKVEDGQHPYLIRQYLGANISLESLVILTDMARCFSYWNKQLSDDIIWKDLAKRILKYKPFLQYDKEKYRKLVVEHFMDINNNVSAS